MFARAAALSLTWAVLLAPNQSHAIDLEGNYATRGLGNLTCTSFAQAKDNDGSLYYNFSGWIDGFLSAVNFFEERTFDVAPWQSTDLIAASLARYCKANPDLAFHTAVSRLVIQLGDQRLATLSPKVVLEERVDERDVRMAIYLAVIERLQARLKAAGLLEGEDVDGYDAPTRRALLAYQRDKGLQETGLPDQATLLLLFDTAASSN